MTLIVACGLPAFPDAAPLYPGYGVVVRYRLLDQGLDISLASKLAYSCEICRSVLAREWLVWSMLPRMPLLCIQATVCGGHWLMDQSLSLSLASKLVQL